MIVTLLTDFGTSDPFVGLMKGHILKRAPDARLIDLTHEVPPQDTRAARFWLERSYRDFPTATVHLAVVDPGVGTQRRALALHADGHVFVGPDNGLFAGLVSGPHDVTVVAIDVERLARERLLPRTEPSRTFQGRDVFAPVAGWLAGGESLTDVGTEIDAAELVLLQELASSVVVVDHFGNLVTNIDWSRDREPPRVSIGGRELRWVETYAEGGPHEAVALLGSFGTIEIAVSGASAAQLLQLGVGAPVVVR